MPSSLPTDLLPLLCCPACKSSLEAAPQGFRCAACGKDFPEIRGVVRFVDSQNYADSFGYQWKRFSKTQLHPERSERNFRNKARMREEDVRGKLVLDVGCGMGRFAEVATRWGGRVVGVDLSEAAEVAASNLDGRDFVAFQTDVFSLPFKHETFDCIYSIGVLHHTPNCEAAFKSLVPYLKPGGCIAIWLYSGYNKWYRLSDEYRKITHRIPVKYLHAFLRVAVPPIYWLGRGLRATPIIGAPLAALLQYVFPVNQSLYPEIRVLDTLDWYSPKYQSKHTYEEVVRWFEACGLERLTVANIIPVGVKAYKPPSVQPTTLAVPQFTSGELPPTSVPARGLGSRTAATGDLIPY